MASLRSETLNASWTLDTYSLTLTVVDVTIALISITVNVIMPHGPYAPPILLSTNHRGCCSPLGESELSEIEATRAA